jgi:excisionase family DNA binding protein
VSTEKNLGRRAYTPAEVAELYGVTVDTVWVWLQTGEMAGMKISAGKRAKWRISPASLDEFDRTHLRNRCSPRDQLDQLHDTAAGS